MERAGAASVTRSVLASAWILAAAATLVAAGPVGGAPVLAAPEVGESTLPSRPSRRTDVSETIVFEAVADTWVGVSWMQVYGEPNPPASEPPRGQELRLVTGNHDQHRGASYAFVGFDLSEMPVGSYVRDATLQLFAERSYGGPWPVPVPSACVGPETGSWDEASLVAGNFPPFPDRDTYWPTTCTCPEVDQWSTWNVTTMVRYQLATGASHGFRIGAGPITTRFSSRESGRAPRLVLTVEEHPPNAVLFVPLAAGGGGVAGLDPMPLTQPPTPQSRPSDLPWLMLEAKAEDLEFGERPLIAAGWVNHTDETVTVIRPVDASTTGWRMPMYLWDVTRADGRPARQRDLQRCGLYSALDDDDFLDLAPGRGASFGGEDPYGWLGADPHGYSFVDPGTYHVRLLYALDKEGGLLPVGVEGRWAEAAEMAVVSEPVTITVASPTGRFAQRIDASRSVTHGMPMGEVASAMGPADQHVDGDYSVHSHFWVYYLADPREGEPALLERPQDDHGGGEYWRPRFVIAFDRSDRVAEASLLP
jgi:hypothetical protein